MSHAISLGAKPTQADITAAKFNRDFYVVFLKHTSGAYVPETSIQSSTMEQLVADIIETQLDMPEAIESIVHFNPVAGVSRIVDSEVADAVAERTHALRQTPHESVIEWLEQFRCDFFESDEYLTKLAEDELHTLADWRYEQRRDRQLDRHPMAAE